MAEKRKKILQTIREEDGTYRFTGDYYRLCQEEASGRSRMAGPVILYLLTAAPVIISGCVDASVAYAAFYVILPFVGEVSALFVLTWNFVKLVFQSQKVRSYVLDQAESRIPGAALVLSGFALAGLLLSLAFLFRYGTGGKTAASILYPVCKGLAALLALGFRKSFLGLQWERVDPS